MFTVEVTWGERLTLALDRWENPARKRTTLFGAVASITNAKSPNTIAKLQKKLEAPVTLNDRIRSAVLLLAIGENPADYDLSEEELPRQITAENVEAELRKLNIAWNMTHSAAA